MAEYYIQHIEKKITNSIGDEFEIIETWEDSKKIYFRYIKKSEDKNPMET